MAGLAGRMMGGLVGGAQVIVADPKPDAACTGAPENAKRGASLTTPAPVAADAATSAPVSSTACEF